jgi:hypothetical protein
MSSCHVTVPFYTVQGRGVWNTIIIKIHRGKSSKYLDRLFPVYIFVSDFRFRIRQVTFISGNKTVFCLYSQKRRIFYKVSS